ncbi:KRAB [Lepeophtheirus salmonis]|uniref:KRAB n=1 Tax=Lepeophtheirus salmonis TaxID=72036 RepID=A0A7R8CEU9_LEPSM|nr:KRAB [Lepeophtheirus salmonis]CAF2799272.1 KRAB [Lepeophtheirus salmonis]
MFAYVFKQSSPSDSYARSHYKGNKITCETCGKTFKWQSSLVRHTRFVHSSPTLSVKYGCKFCGKSFKDQSSLKDHVFTHTGDKPFKCDDSALNNFTDYINIESPNKQWDDSKIELKSLPSSL